MEDARYFKLMDVMCIDFSSFFLPYILSLSLYCLKLKKIGLHAANRGMQSYVR